MDVIPGQLQQDLFAVLLSIVVGGLIGIERQSREKAAGLRTMIFICMGAALYTILSRRLGSGDPARVAAQIVSGIGFLGAGVILRHGSRVIGVTTAAAIWIAAALGMGIGAGQYVLVMITTVIVVSILWCFRLVTRLIDRLHAEHAVTISMTDSFDTGAIDALLTASGLHCQSRSFEREGRRVSCTLQLTGPAQSHKKLIESLLDNPRVEGLHE